jgi:hypothetical protein
MLTGRRLQLVEKSEHIQVTPTTAELIQASKYTLTVPDLLRMLHYRYVLALLYARWREGCLPARKLKKSVSPI